jgi:hypothetical protein
MSRYSQLSLPPPVAASRVTFAIVLVGALTVAGCGHDARSVQPPRTMSQVLTTASAAPDPPSRIRTKIVGGPLVFRVIGAPKPSDPGFPSNAQIRYLVIFRLNRQPRFSAPAWDPLGPVRLPTGIRTTLGNYSLAGLQYDMDVSVAAFNPLGDHRDTNNCFAGWITQEQPRTLRKLDALPIGARVAVTLQPTTPTPDGRPTLTKLSRRYPRLQEMHVVHGSFETDASASRSVGQIGCSTGYVVPPLSVPG